jgi:ElaA protein
VYVFNSSAFALFSLARLYEILQLRVEVFVVEQQCAYSEIDALDSEALHLWIDDRDGLASYVRVVGEPDCLRIGRVVTRRDARSNGLSRQLINHVLSTTDGPWVLSAQSYLCDWYTQLGFVPSGPEFDEDGIPHISMRRAAT